MKNVSVIIAAANPDSVRYILKSLSEQREHIKEIIVVEDWVYEKDFRMQRLAKQFDSIYLRLPTPKRSPYDQRCGSCKTLGLSMATGDIILWLDDDCVPCLWYIERLLQVHNEYPDCAFNGHRIYMMESASDLNDNNWKSVIGQWDNQRRNQSAGFKHYKGFWDNTKEPPFGVYGNNLSVSRKNAIRVGPFINYFSYGEEDLYWGYKAYKLGIRGIYQRDISKDLFVCHLKHEGRPYSREFTAINRLWLYEQDPEFMEACYNVRGDWVIDEQERILSDGIQASPVFNELIDLPDCLRKYIK